MFCSTIALVNMPISIAIYVELPLLSSIKSKTTLNLYMYYINLIYIYISLSFVFSPFFLNRNIIVFLEWIWFMSFIK